MATNPSLKIFHANAKGTGCAMEITLCPAHDECEGAIVMRLAEQMTIGGRRTDPSVYPEFNWDNAASIRLCFPDLTEIVRVFRGETESINDGNGLFHHTADRSQVIKFCHVIEPVCGYCIDVYEERNGGDHHTWHMFLSPPEALGVCLAIENSFGAIVFGSPVIKQGGAE